MRARAGFTLRLHFHVPRLRTWLAPGGLVRRPLNFAVAAEIAIRVFVDAAAAGAVVGVSALRATAVQSDSVTSTSETPAVATALAATG